MRNAMYRASLQPVSHGLRFSFAASFVSVGSFLTIAVFTASLDLASGTPAAPLSSARRRGQGGSPRDRMRVAAA
ncbi:MAG TPA: hypothetical protein VFQ55_10640 [Casimicrobiaceae bacterium]|nr:hypothetical protein [Casimicrobiaceae bacterium]